MPPKKILHAATKTWCSRGKKKLKSSNNHSTVNYTNYTPDMKLDIFICSFHLLKNLMKWVDLYLFYKWGNWFTEKLIDLPKSASRWQKRWSKKHEYSRDSLAVILERRAVCVLFMNLWLHNALQGTAAPHAPLPHTWRVFPRVHLRSRERNSLLLGSDIVLGALELSLHLWSRIGLNIQMTRLGTRPIY